MLRQIIACGARKTKLKNRCCNFAITLNDCECGRGIARPHGRGARATFFYFSVNMAFT
jgi:hypothetical protein